MADELIDLLREVSHAFQARLQDLPAFEALGLTPFQGRLVSVIGRRPGISQQAIAARTGRDKAQVARTVKELEARGLLRRATHEHDWRMQCLSLTEAGARAAAAIDAERDALGVQVVRDIDPAQRAAMVSGLAAIRAAMAVGAPAGHPTPHPD